MDTLAGVVATAIIAKARPFIPDVVPAVNTKSLLLRILSFIDAGLHFLKRLKSCTWYAMILIFPPMNYPGKWNCAR